MESDPAITFEGNYGPDRAEHRATVRRVKKVSNLLDEAIRIPGTNVRVGLDPILGIIPGAGDLVAALASLYIVFEGYRADVPRDDLLKMVALVGIDAVVGSIPVVGPLFDAVWKANVWNAQLVEDHLTEDSPEAVPVV